MSASTGSADELFVSIAGDDRQQGTREAPFATLERARDEIRERKVRGTLSEAGVTVWICTGDYYLDESFILGRGDGGREKTPVVYRACEREEVRLIGGKLIPAEAFHPVAGDPSASRLQPEARQRVVVADLKKLGIAELAPIPTRFRGGAGLEELFFDDRRMTVARWPDEGWAEIDSILEQGSIPRQGETDGRPGAFRYSGGRPDRWAGRDFWLHGYWCFDWYDEAIRVAAIDPEQKRIDFAAPHHYGIRQGNPPPRRWRAIEILEELDAPGEYYIDRRAGRLYFWPPADLAGARIVLSTLADPLVKIAETANLHLRGLIVENGRGTGIEVEAGTNVQILACTVRNLGGTGIRILGGDHHRVEACDIHDTGTLGLVLQGGDRPTLTPADHEAVNNHIYRFGRLQRTYASGIQIGGVGNRATHNLLHDAPHQAIGLSGNDHLIEYNTVHHVAMETDDCGAFYKGRNPSNRGNVIRYNFWHHVGSPRGHGNNAVYFDDGDGGDVVFGNIFLRCGEPAQGNMAAVFSHGGHDLLIENNIFIECKRAIGASPWNDERWKKMIEGELWQERLLREVDITGSLFLARYPRLRNFMDPQGEPRLSEATRNLVVMCGEFFYGNFETRHNWVTDRDPGFIDIAAGDFSLREDAPVFERIPGFQPIRFAEIGLFVDDLRPTLPDDPWTYDPPQPIPPPRPPKTWEIPESWKVDGE